MSDRERGSKGWRARGFVLAAAGVALAGAYPLAGAAVAPSLGAARGFAVLGASTVTNAGPSAITGDVGVSPGTSITGFPPGVVTGGTLHSADGPAAAAQADAATAFGVLGGMTVPAGHDLTGLDLGGMTLTPGVYGFDTTAGLTGILTLDAGCDPAAIFVFKVGTALTTASGASVVLVNEGGDFDESGVYWRIGSSATLGTGTAFLGTIIASADITVASGASLVGAAIALTGAVTLDDNVVLSPPLPAPPGTLLLTPYWGHVTDAKAPRKDVTQVRATYEYAGSPDGVLDPRADGMTIVHGPLGEVAPLTLVIPAGHPRWKLKKGAWIWAERVDGVNWSVKVDDVNQVITLIVSRLDFNPGDGAAGNWGGDDESFPSTLSITSGNDAGSETACFRNSLKFNHTRNWGVLRIP